MTTRFAVLLMLLLCWALPAQAEGLIASVDRTRPELRRVGGVDPAIQ